MTALVGTFVHGPIQKCTLTGSDQHTSRLQCFTCIYSNWTIHMPAAQTMLLIMHTSEWRDLERCQAHSYIYGQF